MLNRDDIIAFLIDNGGELDTDSCSYPIVRLESKSKQFGMVYHMVDSDLCFERDMYILTGILPQKRNEMTFLYSNLECIGINTILTPFFNM